MPTLPPLLQQLLVRRDEVEQLLLANGWQLAFDGVLRRWDKGGDLVATPGGEPTAKSAEGWAAHLDRAAAFAVAPALPSPDAPPSQGGPVESLPLMLTGNWCLHCMVMAATKLEGADGFTLCDACYFQTFPAAPQSAQDRLIMWQSAEIVRLAGELERARNMLCGGG